jgi:hypothetical protein
MDASDLPEMAFAVVHDVAATWDDYRRVRSAVDDAAGAGLIMHAAGPTDDGFRTIDVWDSEGAWLRFRDLLSRAFDDLAIPPVVRELHLGHLISAPHRSLNQELPTEEQQS